jgi:hypothetical protein
MKRMIFENFESFNTDETERDAERNKQDQIYIASLLTFKANLRRHIRNVPITYRVYADHAGSLPPEAPESSPLS